MNGSIEIQEASFSIMMDTAKIVCHSIIAQLAQKTGKPAPAPLAGLAGKAVRFTDVTGKDEMTQVVTEFLR